MLDLPKKLKHDAIVEALLEIRFEHSEVAEIIVGRLAAASQWSGYQNQRLPFADFPAVVRDADPNLRYQPIFQLVRPFPGEIVKVGPRVLSIHVLSPYPGWSAFSVRLREAVQALYGVCAAPTITRLGLRYINALTPVHGISSIWDLDFEFCVARKQPAEEMTAAYRLAQANDIQAQVTLASPGFVTGNLPPHAIAYVDVDVSTPVPLGTVGEDKLMNWVEQAHEAEKKAFFALWPVEVLKPLRED